MNYEHNENLLDIIGGNYHQYVNIYRLKVMLDLDQIGEYLKTYIKHNEIYETAKDLIEDLSLKYDASPDENRTHIIIITSESITAVEENLGFLTGENVIIINILDDAESYSIDRTKITIKTLDKLIDNKEYIDYVINLIPFDQVAKVDAIKVTNPETNKSYNVQANSLLGWITQYLTFNRDSCNFMLFKQFAGTCYNNSEMNLIFNGFFGIYLLIKYREYNEEISKYEDFAEYKVEYSLAFLKSFNDRTERPRHIKEFLDTVRSKESSNITRFLDISFLKVLFAYVYIFIIKKEPLKYEDYDVLDLIRFHIKLRMYRERLIAGVNEAELKQISEEILEEAPCLTMPTGSKVPPLYVKNLDTFDTQTTIFEILSSISFVFQEISIISVINNPHHLTTPMEMPSRIIVIKDYGSPTAPPIEFYNEKSEKTFFLIGSGIRETRRGRSISHLVAGIICNKIPYVYDSNKILTSKYEIPTLAIRKGIQQYDWTQLKPTDVYYFNFVLLVYVEENYYKLLLNTFKEYVNRPFIPEFKSVTFGPFPSPEIHEVPAIPSRPLVKKASAPNASSTSVPRYARLQNREARSDRSLARAKALTGPPPKASTDEPILSAQQLRRIAEEAIEKHSATSKAPARPPPKAPTDEPISSAEQLRRRAAPKPPPRRPIVSVSKSSARPPPNAAPDEPILFAEQLRRRVEEIRANRGPMPEVSAAASSSFVPKSPALSPFVPKQPAPSPFVPKSLTQSIPLIKVSEGPLKFIENIVPESGIDVSIITPQSSEEEEEKTLEDSYFPDSWCNHLTS
jgi:hypothetical protein